MKGYGMMYLGAVARAAVDKVAELPLRHKPDTLIRVFDLGDGRALVAEHFTKPKIVGGAPVELSDNARVRRPHTTQWGYWKVLDEEPLSVARRVSEGEFKVNELVE